ncbi:prepilin-type N-terminal cleavage/methylation domain-containing protein [Acididesulfobacillus acetoxydans]|nr:prepilin-type N-terminal cleavage/methylation domain-containing protein [Acididesulfobacillus acetoxydans]
MVSQGFTLLETLAALLLSGILLAVGLPLLTGQWRGEVREKRQLEVLYGVMNAGRCVTDAVRSAAEVEFSRSGVLRVRSWDQTGVSAGTDEYRVADLDGDGNPDLYRKHEGEINPVAGRISGFQCKEVAQRVWQVDLQASWGDERASWSTLVYRRADSAK